MAVVRPTVDDLIGWLKLQTAPDDADYAVYVEAFDAAQADVESRLNNDLVVGAGYSLVAEDDNYPPQVRSATLLAASRLAQRSETPNGTMGFGGDGIIVRIGKLDPDVEWQLRHFKKVGFY